MTTLSDFSPRSLRRRAEDRLFDKASLAALSAENMTPHTMAQLVHELQVHQVELEMQNEELRSTQLELDTTLSRYFDLYDLAPVGYCTISDQGIVLEANLAAAELLGVVRSELIRQPIRRFITPTDRDQYDQFCNELFDVGIPHECELQMLKDRDTSIWVHLRATVAVSAEWAPVQRLMLSDIDQRKRMDVMLLKKSKELETARAVAEQAGMVKTDFLSNMSHELRSPLNAILGFAQLMRMSQPEPTSAQNASIEQILQAGWNLLDLINEVLDFSSAQAGELIVLIKPIAVAEVLQDCQVMVAEQAKKKSITMYFASLPATLMVDADRGRLTQVIVNLLLNAIQYNRVGGSLEVTCSAHSDTRLRIAVRDTGEGLPSEKMAQLFEPFNRLGREATADEGTGVGLALSKRLVEVMGGSIGVQSTVGVGSVFWVELNLCPATVDATAPATSAVTL